MVLLPQNMIYRRALGAMFAIFIAVFISHQVSFAEEFWITTTCMLVMQTAVGLTGRQGLQRLLVIILCVLIASYYIFYQHQRMVVDIAAIIFIAVLCYFSLAAKVIRPQVVIPLMIGIVVLMVLVIPFFPLDKTMMRVIDVVSGGLLGFFASILILPVRADVEFRKEAIPLLNACSDYLAAIIHYMFDHSLVNELVEKKMQLEVVWEDFPDWVYEAGFIAMLQQGHRHFLVRIEEVRQILLMLDHLARHEYDYDLLKKFKTVTQSYQVQIERLIQSITTVLTLQKLSEGVDDLTEEFEALEKKFKSIMPYSLEMLEINRDYVYLANFIFELKELGKMLVILARTLRAS